MKIEDKETVFNKYEPNNIYNVDCYEAIKKISDKSIDLIVTDPPYEIETVGGNTNIGKTLNGMCKQLEDLNIIDGINIEILDEFMRIMKKPNIYIWCNKKQVIEYLNYFVTKNGCSFEIMVWIKTNPTPLCGGNYLIDKEFCLYFRKGVKLNTKFETAATYWISPKNKSDKDLYCHPTIKPLEFVKNHILNATKENDIVLDCFLGSGTTAVACKETGRRYIGFEINKDYFKIAQDRINGISQIDNKLKEAGIQTIFDFME